MNNESSEEVKEAVVSDAPMDTLDGAMQILRRQMEKETAKETHYANRNAETRIKKDEDEEKPEALDIAVTPAQRALKYYERAKQLYTRGGGSSLELEIIIRDVVLAASFTEPDPKMFYFLAKVFRQQLDFSGCIYALRNVIRIDPKVNRAARTMLGEVLYRRAMEIMGEATIIQQEIDVVNRSQTDVLRHYTNAKAAAEEQIAKQDAYKRQRRTQQAMALKLRGTAAEGTIHVPVDIPFEDVAIPFKPILLRVPKRMQQYVSDQYRLARGYFEECMEFDRDNYKIIMSKAICHVYATEYAAAIESITRAIHLGHVRLKELVPAPPKSASSKQEIDQAAAAGPPAQPPTLSDDNKQEMDDETIKDGEEDAGSPGAKNKKHVSAAHTTNSNIYYRDYFKYETDEIAAEVKKLSKQVGEMLILRGKAYGATGLTQQGNQDLRKANSIIPDHPECVKFGVRSFLRAEKIYNMCLSKFKKGENDEALKLILMAISLSGEDIKLHIMQARIHRTLEELEKAFQAIQKATELYQSCSDFERRVPEEIVKETNMIYNDIALQCAGEGQYEKAILLLNKVIVTESQLARNSQDIDYRFLLNRGDCHRAKKQYAQALLDYNAAMTTLVSNKLGASSGLEGARRQWLISTRLSITNYLVACDYFNESAFADAEHHLTQAIEQNPKVAEYYATRGKTRYYCGSYQAAYDDFKATLKIDPDHADAQKRLKQFVSLQVVDTDEKGKKEKEVGMTLSQTKGHGSVTTIVPSTVDVIETLLNPRSSKKLPDITMRSQSAKEAERHKPKMIPSTDSRVVSQTMLMPSLATAAYKKKHAHFQAALDTKYDTTKGVHWTMLKNAQKMAVARSRPPIDRVKTGGKSGLEMAESAEGGMGFGDDFEKETVESEGGTRRHVMKSYTASGLKRYSAKQTIKALKNGGLVAGVITHENDPHLAGASESGGGKGKKASKPFTIDVSARPRVNKFVKQRPAEAGGEVSTFKSVNHFADMENDANWRDRMRDDGVLDMDLLAALTGSDSSFFDTPGSSVSAGGYKTLAQRQAEAALARAEAKAERKKQRAARRLERLEARAAAAADFKDEMSDDDDDDDEEELRLGQIDKNGVVFLGREFLKPLAGESEEDFQKRRSIAESFLSSNRMSSSGIASLVGGEIDFGNFDKALHDDEENVSSLIALTEEQEMQIAFEERIKSEHEEARRKKQERLREKMEKMGQYGATFDESDEDN